jgi:aryl-alcohol dehydrogenase-like predicted oxidoreductase
VQTVYNLLEQEPGRELLEAATQHDAGVMARVPTSSGLLDDNLTPETRFGDGDHRRHRPPEWLVEGLQKIERIRFLCEPGSRRTMAQAALRFILDTGMTTVIPTITSGAEMREYAAASDAPRLSADELARVGELYERNFDVEPVSA